MVLASKDFGPYPNKGSLLRNALDSMMEAEAMSDYSLRPNKNTQSSYPAKGLANPFESNDGSESNLADGILIFSDSESEISDTDDRASKQKKKRKIPAKNERCKKQKINPKPNEGKLSSSTKRKHEEEISEDVPEEISEEKESNILEQIDKRSKYGGDSYTFWHEYFNDNAGAFQCTFDEFTRIR